MGPGASPHCPASALSLAAHHPIYPAMPQGDKRAYTAKQKRQAEHIEDGYEKKGVTKDEAEARAWATVNKNDGGGQQPGGAGRKKPGK